MKYAVIFHKTKTGYSAHVPDLPGCIAAAKTFRATEKLMREAIALHIELTEELGEKVPRPVTQASYVEISEPKVRVARVNGRAKRRIAS